MAVQHDIATTLPAASTPGSGIADSVAGKAHVAADRATSALSTAADRLENALRPNTATTTAATTTTETEETVVSGAGSGTGVTLEKVRGARACAMRLSRLRLPRTGTLLGACDTERWARLARCPTAVRSLALRRSAPS